MLTLDLAKSRRGQLAGEVYGFLGKGLVPTGQLGLLLEGPELATELGYQGEKNGSAEMNIWLHKEVMRQLAAHGGKVPSSMTD